MWAVMDSNHRLPA